MNEIAEHLGTFHAWDHPRLSNEQLKDLFTWGDRHLNRWLWNYKRCPNILMATQKLAMANAVYPSIDRLVITSQTATPQDNETSYSGTIYTTVAADEFTRSGNANPYTVGWNILDDDANGSWGSFILVTEAGAMINRALAGVSKTTGTAKLIIFTGSVTS